MQDETKKIKDEFGFESEAEAVKEYSLLNRDFMYTNYPLIAEEITSRLKFTKGIILDIGTGLGSLAIEFARKLPESKVYGIDVSQEMLKEAESLSKEKRISNVEFRNCDVHNMTFQDNYFDLIISFGVLHHLKDIKLAFSQITRVLKAGGLAYVYDLRKDSPQEVVAEIANQMNPDQKRAFLESLKEDIDLVYLEDILKNLGVSEYSLAYPKYSRRTIIKNKELLRSANFLGERFNKILVECFLLK